MRDRGRGGEGGRGEGGRGGEGRGWGGGREGGRVVGWLVFIFGTMEAHVLLVFGAMVVDMIMRLKGCQAFEGCCSSLNSP